MYIRYYVESLHGSTMLRDSCIIMDMNTCMRISFWKPERGEVLYIALKEDGNIHDGFDAPFI